MNLELEVSTCVYTARCLTVAATHCSLKWIRSQNFRIFSRSITTCKRYQTCVFFGKALVVFGQKSPESGHFYIPDFFRETRTLNPTLREFRMLDQKLRNGVWDSGITDFYPDVVHLWCVVVVHYDCVHTNLVEVPNAQHKADTKTQHVLANTP